MRHHRLLAVVTIIVVACPCSLAGEGRNLASAAPARMVALDADGQLSGAGNISERDATRAYERARDLLEANDQAAGVKALERVLEQFPASRARFDAHLALAKHLLDKDRDPAGGLRHLAAIRTLEQQPGNLTGDLLERYLEAVYLTGVTLFRQGNYREVFAVLSRITGGHPNTVWANQAYYYIGMAHFMLENWTQAIEQLSKVGTFVDPAAEGSNRVEAGQRLYVKVQDSDLPVLVRLGQQVWFEVEAASGDRVRRPLVPLSVRESLFLGSVPTAMGEPVVDDEILQICGGEEITVRYIDGNTEDGQRNAVRAVTVRAVSTGTMAFTRATYEGRAEMAFIAEGAFLALRDCDLDHGGQADTICVRVAARRRSDESAGSEVDSRNLTWHEEETGPRWWTRDEVMMTLVEQAAEDGSHHTGLFAARIPLALAQDGAQPSSSDGILECRPGDELLASYIDDLHIGGPYGRTVSARVPVSGGSGLTTVPDGDDPNTDRIMFARKRVLEAEILLEMARIFGNLGLEEGLRDKVREGLGKSEPLLQRLDLPPDLIQEAYVVSWDLSLEGMDSARALAFCNAFVRRFPDARQADDALLGIGKACQARGELTQALEAFARVLEIRNAGAKAEALYRIAECKMAAGPGQKADDVKRIGVALKELRATAELYPESPFAGMALRRLVQHAMASGDLASANDLLGRIFVDHPNADWLPGMLALSVQLHWQLNDLAKARHYAQKLLLEYPSATEVGQARRWLEKIEQALGRGQGAGEAAPPVRGTEEETVEGD